MEKLELYKRSIINGRLVLTRYRVSYPRSDTPQDLDRSVDNLWKSHSAVDI